MYQTRTRFRRPHLPPVRTWIAVVVACVALVAGVLAVTRVDSGRTAAGTWFGGYVDVTTTPPYQFEKFGSPSTSNVLLSFVVASFAQPCTPSWAGTYSLDDAQQAWQLDDRVATFVRRGGQAAISFGGVFNNELSTACQNEPLLLGSYRTVMDRYHLNTMDFDIEEHNLEDVAAGQRRAQVVAALQQERRAAGKELNVWLTLPVTPSGLTANGTAMVQQMLLAGVDLAGVNLMTMNYGDSRPAGMNMLDAGKQAAGAAHGQLAELYRNIGQPLDDAGVWKKIGVTPMIGQNDLPGEVFDLDAAQALNGFAREEGVGRVSMWSLNRDVPCSDAASTGEASHGCSGIAQRRGAFTDALSAELGGRLELKP